MKDDRTPQRLALRQRRRKRNEKKTTTEAARLHMTVRASLAPLVYELCTPLYSSMQACARVHKRVQNEMLVREGDLHGKKEPGCDTLDICSYRGLVFFMSD